MLIVLIVRNFVTVRNSTYFFENITSKNIIKDHSWFAFCHNVKSLYYTKVKMIAIYKDIIYHTNILICLIAGLPAVVWWHLHVRNNIYKYSFIEMGRNLQEPIFYELWVGCAPKLHMIGVVWYEGKGEYCMPKSVALEYVYIDV